MEHFKEMINNFLSEKEKTAFNEVCNLENQLNPYLLDLIKILVVSKNELVEKTKILEDTTEHNDIILENNVKNLQEINTLMNTQFKYILETLDKQEALINFEIKNCLEIVVHDKKKQNKFIDEKIALLTEATADDYLNLKRSHKALESKCDRSISMLQKYLDVKIPQLEERIILLEKKDKNNKFKQTFIITFCFTYMLIMFFK